MHDLLGKRFGRLVVESIERSGRKTYALCRCDCGATKRIRADSMTRGDSTSCGCRCVERLRTHGHGSAKRRSPTYTSWCSMIYRCSSPVSTEWARYGKRGITVCDRWRESFENFLADMGERPDGTSIDRIDNSRGYEPGNCRWADPSTQSTNKRNNVMLTFAGRTMTLSAWARELGVSRGALRGRLARGLPHEAVFVHHGKHNS